MTADEGAGGTGLRAAIAATIYETVEWSGCAGSSWRNVGRGRHRAASEGGPMSGRVTTIRIPDDMAVEVETVARALGISASEVYRTAIAEYLTRRKSEVEFRQRLAARIEQDKRILERLGDECNCCCDRTTARLVVCPAHPDRTKETQ